MKKTIFLIVASKFLVLAATAQMLQAGWQLSGGGTGNEYIEETCLINGNAVAVTGTFAGSMDINGTTYNSIGGGNDIFVIKYTKNNTIEWVKTFGNACHEKVTGITSDASGNIYLTGSFYNALSIDNNTVLSAGSEDLFMASLDTDGNLNWLQSVGSTGSDAGISIKASPDGTIVLAASLSNTGFPQADQPAVGVSAHVAKFTATGMFIWSNCESADPSGSIRIEDMAIDNTGTIMVTGSFYGSVLAGDNGTIALQSGPSRIWAGSYHTTGSTNFIYTPSVSASNISGGCSVEITNGSHAVIAGYTSGQMTIGNITYSSSDNDLVLLELNGDGMPVWSSVVVAAGYQQPNDIAVNSTGQLGVSGLFVYNFDFGSNSLTNMGGSDGFLMICENGSVSTLTGFQSSGNDNATTLISRDEEFISGGNFSGNSTTTMSVGSVILQSNGNDDFFMASFTKIQTTGILEQEPVTMLKAYPNPAVSYINLEGDFTSGMVQVSVYSADGRKVISMDSDPGFDSRITFNTEEFKTGNYIAVIEDAGKRSTVNFMVQ